MHESESVVTAENVELIMCRGFGVYCNWQELFSTRQLTVCVRLISSIMTPDVTHLFPKSFFPDGLSGLVGFIMK